MPYKNQAVANEKARKRYQEYKERGFCPKCKKKNDSDNTYCQECREKRNRISKDYRERNKPEYLAKMRELSKKYRERDRSIVLEHYGKKCACCGETTLKFLTIDHINNDGKLDSPYKRHHIYRWIIKNDFPKDFQILCWNCNVGKNLNDGICPHKRRDGY